MRARAAAVLAAGCLATLAAAEPMRVKVAVELSYAPFLFVDEQGVPRGIAVDALRAAAAVKPGLELEFTPAAELSTLLPRLEAGALDVHPALTQTPERARTLSFTTPYFSVPAVVVVRRDRAFSLATGGRVAVGRGYGVVETLRREHPGLTLEEVADDTTGLRRLAGGAVDAAVLDLASASWIIQANGLQGLEVQEDVGFTYQLAMAASSPALRAELDARLAAIDPRELDRIRRHWVPLAVGSRRLELGLGLAVLLLVATVVVGWLGRRTLRATITHRTEALARSERRFRALIERSSDLTLVLDDAGAVTFASPAARPLLGVTPEALVGQTLRARVHPDDAAALEGLRGVAGEARHVELRLRRDDGNWAQLELSTLDLSAEPSVRGVVLNGRDVTERNRFREQWLQSQKLESVGRLAGGVAHDLNNLLTVIKSCGEELREAVASGTTGAPEVVADLLESTRRATELTSQLLVFARKRPHQPQVLELNELLTNHAKLLPRLLGEDVRVALQPSEQPWHAWLDPGLASQLVMNLAANARDAMPGGGTLTLQTANVSVSPGAAPPALGLSPGDWVRLRVQDTGVGMPPEVLEHLFEPFFTTKPVGKGTGLGLATVHGIAVQSGAVLDVRSKPGEGTTFDVYFKRCLGAPRAEPATPREARRGGGETILAVEDEPLVRQGTTRALLAAGYRVLAASSGEEALALASREPGRIDLVLTDVVMPGMSGRELWQRLTAVRPEARVLFVSGYDDQAVTRHGGLEPHLPLLPKPFGPDELKARVRAVLDTAPPPGRPGRGTP